MLIFVSGGVRSRKSTIAEHMVEKLKKGHSRCMYIATGNITDEEMKERVKLHQEEREKSIVQWETMEIRRDLQGEVSFFRKEDIVLLDCATNWMANELFASYDGWEDTDFQREIIENMKEAVKEINERASHLVIVSNELFEGGTLYGATFVYMKLLGSFHQWLVQEADIAIAAEAGAIVMKKGVWQNG
ncbi:bifunctional adenosylcobinamide kinase/adenosylcobinamide-phosphate guanylyltransferase [Priestia abyssalis]|uniref:bifunctional adenosylcobinamide kinase/adenosylcobinamide-phosphate guanylyltransferase n=1 Tax=Priestia abyssalis TaxID=1221450 RepID=UPI000994CF18|nr:bifunctional adenosylcobinamide kinase/adenosylcobinamide-phosphate guanylyltransferase [Priestia abyssalis]